MKSSAANVHPFGDEIPPELILFGCTPEMAAIRESLHKIASTNIPVLIEGESGTGKELICKYLHRLSAWSSGPFVKVNCPAIPNTLVESELFGYEKGAFTGAFDAKPGRVEMAHCGTLFLDEISELDLSLQSKLLQLLQDGQFCRIGAQRREKGRRSRDLRHQSAIAPGSRQWQISPRSLLPHHGPGVAASAFAGARRRHLGAGGIPDRAPQREVQAQGSAFVRRPR